MKSSKQRAAPACEIAVAIVGGLRLRHLPKRANRFIRGSPRFELAPGCTRISDPQMKFLLKLIG